MHLIHTFQSMYDQAVQLATALHAHQRYGGVPYRYHLAQVESVLVEFGVVPGDSRQDLLIAAWLHDVVEDCHVGRQLILDQFGPTVADLVWAVTNEPGENRKQRHAATYPKILATPGALALKLADRIANVRASKARDLKKLKMYRKEWPDFEAAFEAHAKTSGFLTLAMFLKLRDELKA